MSYLLDFTDNEVHSDRLIYSVIDIEPFKDSLNALCRINGEIYKVTEVNPGRKVCYGKTSYISSPNLILERVGED